MEILKWIFIGFGIVFLIWVGGLLISLGLFWWACRDNDEGARERKAREAKEREDLEKCWRAEHKIADSDDLM